MHFRTGSIVNSATQMFTNVLSVASNLVTKPLGKLEEEFQFVEDMFDDPEKHQTTTASGNLVSSHLSLRKERK